MVKTPPKPGEIKEYAKLAGIEVNKLLNTGSKDYRALGKDVVASMAEEQLLEAMHGNGKLIKRPIIIDGGRAIIGFKEDKYEEFFS